MDLQYYKLFNKDTSQGIVGLLRPFKDSSSSKRSSKAKKSHFKIFSIDNHNMSQSATDYFFVVDEPSYKMYVFKISKDVNTLLDHEFKISKSLEELSPFLPHFNRILEIKRNIKCLLPENKKQRGSGDFNPFIKYNCIRDVSVIEYIPIGLQALLALVLAGACSSLNIVDSNDPDQRRALSDPTSVENVGVGAFQTWYLTGQGGFGEDENPGLTISVMARSHVAMSELRTVHW